MGDYYSWLLDNISIQQTHKTERKLSSQECRTRKKKKVTEFLFKSQSMLKLLNENLLRTAHRN